MALRERFAKIDFDVMDAVRVQTRSGLGLPATLLLNVFDNVLFEGVITSSGRTSTGYWLSGHLAGDELSDVAFVVNGSMVVGTVRVPGEYTYHIQSLAAPGGTARIQQFEPTAFRPDLPPMVPKRSRIALRPGADRARPILPPVLGETGATADQTPREDGNRIDLLVAYTPVARAARGGHREINAWIDLNVVETNRALAESGVILRIHPVATVEVAFSVAEHPEVLCVGCALRDPGDGYMDDVHVLRDRVAADLVMLVVGEGGGSAEMWDVFAPDAAQDAFTTMNWDHPSMVFAHELGHSMGLQHDRYTSLHECCKPGFCPTRPPWQNVCLPANKPFPYSYGYVNRRGLDPDAPASSRWATLMAYLSECIESGISCYHVMRYSNPDLSYGGDPMGVPGDAPSSSVTGPADARRSLNGTRQVVANFRVAPANRRPEPVGTISAQELTESSPALGVPVDGFFRDPDGDPLALTARSGHVDTVTVLLSGAVLWLTPGAAGVATVTVTATDPGGLSATQSFAVTVTQPGNRPPAAAGNLPTRALPVGETVALDVSVGFVDPDGDVLTYTVSSSRPQVVTVRVSGPRVTLTAVRAGTATVRVTATDPGGLSATQSFAVTVTPLFTDDPIVPGVTPVRAVHFQELRARVDALRRTAGLARFSWTDAVLTAGVTPVRFVHLTELRSALAEAYRAAGRPAPGWTDSMAAAGATPIRAAHVNELRTAVVRLEE